MKSTLIETIRQRRLVCDGAMGTQLMLAGLEQGACGELWNLTHPDRVLAIQRRYVEAGTDCLITNTFGASNRVLAGHNQQHQVAAINTAGARLAREAFGGKPGFVLGDVGPLGEILEPIGELKAADARAALDEQIHALLAAGVDALLLETQTALDEVGLGLAAAKAAGAACVIASFAFDRSPDGKRFRTMMGVSPEQAAKFAAENGADVIALNCGRGMDMPGAAEVAQAFRAACSLPIMVQPNAGQPVLEGGKAVYRQTPEEMVRALPDALAAGAVIVGSCCGSAPEHTRAIRAALDAWVARAM
jgi:5-methyltetrahydrofolate--homocysteine methyltransferase